MFVKNQVAVASESDYIRYPQVLPFLPDKIYPELDGSVPVGEERNIVYSLLRQVMINLDLDRDHLDTKDWNPLGDIISPGMDVLVKPNLVRHLHVGGGIYETVVTHSSLVRSVLDYVALALDGKGCITVGDAPIQGADFNQIIQKTGLDQICENISETWGIKVRLIDFRLVAAQMDGHHIVMGSKALDGDDRGYQSVNLGRDSLLSDIINESSRFRVTCYDCGEMKSHHNAEVNEYLIPQTVLDADVVINLPKLKTHRKVGMTTALKNLVGINGCKDWLPHHRIGSKQEGGDEYLHSSYLKRFRTILVEKNIMVNDLTQRSLNSLAVKLLSKIISFTTSDPYQEGSWYGNDTIWRTVLDLNRLLLFANKKGKMLETVQRMVLTIVDGIWAGEGEGPMEPAIRKCGILVGGSSSVAVDAVLATMIGFDYKKMLLVSNGFNGMKWPLVDFPPEEIKVISEDEIWNDLMVGSSCKSLCFKPTSGWLNHIEIDR